MWIITNNKYVLEEDLNLKRQHYGKWLILGLVSNYITMHRDYDDVNEKPGVHIYKHKLEILIDLYPTEKVFYYQVGDEIYITNDLRMLFQIQDIPFVVNVDNCRRYATIRAQVDDIGASDNETFFKDIFKIPSNSFFSYKDGKSSIRQWRDLVKYVNYSCSNERESRKSVRSIVANEIKKQLEISKKQNVGIELSGGVDSACVLGELIKSNVNPKRLYAFIMTFRDEELVNTNDIDLAIQLCEDYGINYFIVYGDRSLKALEYGDMKICDINGPVSSANYFWLQTINKLCKENNIELVFTGNGGDEMLNGSPFIYDSAFRAKPIKTIIKLLNESPIDKKLSRMFKLLVRPTIKPWLYYSQLWREENNPIPSYFTKEQKRLEKRERYYSKIKFIRSKSIKGWGKRFVFDFSIESPSYLDDFFDDIKFVNPLFSFDMFKFVNSVPLHDLFDMTKKTIYSASKKVLRKDYERIVPQYILNKQVKTTYNQMSRKMFLNGFPYIIRMFNGNSSFIAKYGIVDHFKFLYALKRMFVICTDHTSRMNLDYRYMWALINMESWLRFINEGRNSVLKKSLDDSKEHLLCEVVEHASLG